MKSYGLENVDFIALVGGDMLSIYCTSILFATFRFTNRFGLMFFHSDNLLFPTSAVGALTIISYFCPSDLLMCLPLLDIILKIPCLINHSKETSLNIVGIEPERTIRSE